jgi:hypothetical protein
MNFGELLTHLRPPKITPEQFADLKERVEKLGKQGLRETTSNQILSLLEKYNVVVPKEVVEGLLQKPTSKGAHRKPAAMTARQWLAAPKPEAPPDWSLITYKGLHDDVYKSCKEQYQPSLYYKLSKMHRTDTLRAQTAGGSLAGTRPSTRRPTAGIICNLRTGAHGNVAGTRAQQRNWCLSSSAQSSVLSLAFRFGSARRGATTCMFWLLFAIRGRHPL